MIPTEGSPVIFGPDGTIVRRPRARADGDQCPNCKELVAKVGKVSDRAFGDMTKAKIICGACGYEYPS